MPAKEVPCLMWKCLRNPRTVVGMGSELSMGARAEITRKYARASKGDKGRMPGRGVRGDWLEPGQRAQAPDPGRQAPWRGQEGGVQAQGPQVPTRLIVEAPAKPMDRDGLGGGLGERGGVPPTGRPSGSDPHQGLPPPAPPVQSTSPSGWIAS